MKRGVSLPYPFDRRFTSAERVQVLFFSGSVSSEMLRRALLL